jgi:two-component system, chemotaxis family, chemotaxis protein CheY
MRISLLTPSVFFNKGRYHFAPAGSVFLDQSIYQRSMHMIILIVDDDAGIRQLVTVFLEHRGYSAISARNGAEALTHLEHHQPLPQLILLDLMMPVMDGAGFRHAQQQDSRFALIPVVVMSAAENIEAQAPSLTADAYLPKPIDFDALLGLIEQYGGESRARAQ